MYGARKRARAAGGAPYAAAMGGGGGGGAGPVPNYRARAIASSIYNKRKYPGWGKMFIQPNSKLPQYGATWRTATPQQKQQRQMDHVSGHGRYNYPRMVSRAMAPYMKGIGANIGSAFGMRSLGYAAGSAAGRIMGHGEYTGNSLMAGSNTATVPTFRSANDETGALTVMKEEYIQDVLSSINFANDQFQINPGDPGLFPWLSQIAQNYEEYEFDGLVFFYKSVASDTTILTGTTSSSNLGTVMMACNYNAAAAAFTQKDDMVSYSDAKNAKITENIAFGVECDRFKKALGGLLYIAPNGTVPVGEDPKTYNAGSFQIATNQCQNTGGQIGELWVSYSVTLRKPKLSVTKGSALPISSLSFVGSNTGAGEVQPLRYAAAAGQYNNIEDVNYTAQVVNPSSIQVSAGLWNQTANSLLPTTDGNTPPTRTNIGYGQQYIGWNFSSIPATVAASGNASPSANFTYVFPPYLQIGTYDVTILFNCAIANQAGAVIAATVANNVVTVTTSSGITFNSQSSVTSLSAAALTPMTGTGAGGFVFNGSFTLTKSYNGYAETQYLRVNYQGITAVGAAGTFELRASGTNSKLYLKIAQTNPGIVAANVGI